MSMSQEIESRQSPSTEDCFVLVYVINMLGGGVLKHIPWSAYWPVNLSKRHLLNLDFIDEKPQ